MSRIPSPHVVRIGDAKVTVFLATHRLAREMAIVTAALPTLTRKPETEGRTCIRRSQHANVRGRSKS